MILDLEKRLMLLSRICDTALSEVWTLILFVCFAKVILHKKVYANIINIEKIICYRGPRKIAKMPQERSTGENKIPTQLAAFVAWNN